MFVMFFSDGTILVLYSINHLDLYRRRITLWVVTPFLMIMRIVFVQSWVRSSVVFCIGSLPKWWSSLATISLTSPKCVAKDYLSEFQIIALIIFILRRCRVCDFFFMSFVIVIFLSTSYDFRSRVFAHLIRKSNSFKLSSRMIMCQCASPMSPISSVNLRLKKFTSERYSISLT